MLTGSKNLVVSLLSLSFFPVLGMERLVLGMLSGCSTNVAASIS